MQYNEGREDELLKKLDEIGFTEISPDAFIKKFPEFQDKIRRPIQKVWGLKMRADAWADTWVMKVDDKYNPYITHIDGKQRMWSGALFVLGFLKKISESLKEQLVEKLSKKQPAGEWIHDFVHSKNPMFKDKSKKERIQMALGAYYAAQKNEDFDTSTLFKANDDSIEYDPEQLAAGIKIEMEHTDDKEIATIIAKHHLAEDPEYYIKLVSCVEKGIQEEYGAGFEGTDALRDKYIKDTPGQKIQHFKTNMKDSKEKLGAEIEEGKFSMRQLYAVVDSTDNTVVGTASSEEAAQRIIRSAHLPPISSKNKDKLKVVKTKKVAEVGYELKEGNSFGGSLRSLGFIKMTDAEVKKAYYKWASKINPGFIGWEQPMGKYAVGFGQDGRFFIVNKRNPSEIDFYTGEKATLAAVRNLKEESNMDEAINIRDYMATSEKSQFGGYRPHVVRKDGKTMYLSQASYNTADEAKDHAEEYLKQYARGISEPRVPIKGTYVQEASSNPITQLVKEFGMKLIPQSQWHKHYTTNVRKVTHLYGIPKTDGTYDVYFTVMQDMNQPYYGVVHSEGTEVYVKLSDAKKGLKDTLKTMKEESLQGNQEVFDAGDTAGLDTSEISSLLSQAFKKYNNPNKAKAELISIFKMIKDSKKDLSKFYGDLSSLSSAVYESTKKDLTENEDKYPTWIIKPRDGGEPVKIKAQDEPSAIEIALGRKPSQHEIDFFNFHYICICEKVEVSTARNMKIVELATNCNDKSLVKEFVEQQYKPKSSVLEIKESFKSFISNK
jgi:hypothetical protein